MTRTRLRLAALALVVLLGWQLSMHLRTQARAQLPVRAPAAAAADQLLVEPDEGMAGIEALLAAPRRSLDMTMYELVDEQAVSALVADADRGVTVRVLLDQNREGKHNTPAYAALRARGVQVRWAPRGFAATHQKTITVDGSLAAVMTMNLTSQYYPTGREFAVLDRDPADVAAIETVFAADWAGRSVGQPAADDLVWSPRQSAPDLLALIASARVSIAAEQEELAYGPVQDALLAARRRGVRVSLAMTYQQSWTAGFSALVRAGAQVSVFHGERPLYVHAKVLVVDAGQPGARVFVGSENLSAASLLRNRELGIVLLSPQLVSAVGDVVASDVALGSPWQPR